MSDRTDIHVRETDAFTFRMERDPQLRSTITAVAVFDRAPDWDVLVERIDRATRLVPAFRSLLAPSPLHLAPPRWIVDPDFDIGWHIRRVECAPDEPVDAVFERAQVAATTAFDMARPLWRFTLFTGLAEGKAALLMKVHHALTDGIGGIELADYVVDLERRPPQLGPPAPAPRARTRRPGDDLTEAATFAVRRWAGLSGSLAGSLPRALTRTVRDPRRAVLDAGAAAGSVVRFLQPVTSTASPVMTRRSLNRHFSRLDLELDAMRTAASAADATLNDAYLAGILGGMRRYHEHHGAPVESLRLTLPISIRQEGDAVAGNRVTLTRLRVPVSIPDPIERMVAIGEVVRRAREEPALRFSEGIASALNLLPPSVTGSMLKHVDLVATNVPGFPQPIYVGGALVEAFYPYAPTIGASANIGLLSYRDRCHIGVSTDSAAIDDPDVFVACLLDGFEEISTAG